VSKLAEENMKNNPLNNLHIASPCSADWNKMFGNERKRYCAECKLNVYNLSEMSQTEAESFLINSEGRVCIRLYKRSDGTVITQNCPVGLAKIKQKISRLATASLALILTFLSGISAFKLFANFNKQVSKTIEQLEEKKGPKISFGGMANNLPSIKADILRNRILSK
jgi:hypothetical protein